MSQSHNFFRSLPKIDLHLHLDGAVRTRTILDLGEQEKVRLPARTVRGLERYVTVGRNCKSLLDFLERFDVFLPVLRSPEAMSRIAYELCEDQARDGVIYFETRFAPLLQESPVCSMEDSVVAVLDGLRRGGRKFKVKWGLILCFLRPAKPESSMKTAALAAKYRDRGVVAVDIAGDERMPANPHREAFAFARRRGLGITMHAGEAGPVGHIREAIDGFGAARLGHAVRLVESPALLDYVARAGIAIESCLTSNLQTRSVASLADHPFPRFLKAGARVTLNTDDPAISRTTLSREYALAAKAFGLGPGDFARLYENSVKAAFVSESMRRRLFAEGSGFGRDSSLQPPDSRFARE